MNYLKRYYILFSNKNGKRIKSTENPDNNKQFQEFVSDNMSKLLPEHNDSVDAKAIILLLQQEIIDLGYIITSLIPIRLMKKTIH